MSKKTTSRQFFTCTNPCCSIVVDLPPDARLDDLASLLNFDSKTIDKEKLGIDAIKKQQELNLKFSSNQTAVIPDDRAQIMLAGVSIYLLPFTFERESHSSLLVITFERD